MEFIKIFSGLLTPIIGITTLFILALQYSLQRYKVRHDLYEPRMKVYRAVTHFLIHVGQYADAQNEELSSLIQNTAEARFLFKGKIAKHIDLLYRKGLYLQTIQRKLRDERLPIGETRNKLADALLAHNQWFSDQFETTNKLFETYLTLDK